VIELRIYRAAFVPALIAVVVAMFSLESRPPPLPQGLAADALFDGRLTVPVIDRIVAATPDRRPGTTGDRRTAALVARSLAAKGFAVERDRFAAQGKQLVNVVGRRAGKSQRQIVVVAARDARSVPDATSSASDTAALLELARVFQGRPTQKTLVLASVDGSPLGELGVKRLAGELGGPRTVDGVIVLSDLGARLRSGSSIVAWSNDSSRTNIGLERTLAASVRLELRRAGPSARPSGQLARLGFPVGIGGQGVLLESGYDAIRLSGSGELPPSGPGRLSALDEARLGGLGRAALRTVSALDQGPPPRHGPPTYVTVAGQVLAGWAISMLAFVLLLPALLAMVDAFARARRRRHPVGPWLRLIGARAISFVAVVAVAQLLGAFGAIPDPPAPVPPAQNPLDGGAIAVLICLTALGAALWWVSRRLLIRGNPVLLDAGEPGAACAAALVLGAAALVLWVVNPYAALLLVPAVHLWMLATLSGERPKRGARLLLVGVGLLPVVAVAGYYLVRLSIDPVTGLWYLLVLVSGDSVGILTALIGCAVLAVLGTVVWIARRPDRETAAGRPAEGARVYRLGREAGPEALGGTGSRMRG
jgi:Peptidase family M28